MLKEKKEFHYGGNFYNKYEAKSPAVRFVVKRYLKDIRDFVSVTGAEKILDAGCGEGYVVKDLKEGGVKAEFYGVDSSTRILFEQTRKIVSGFSLACNSVYSLCFKEDSFDLVLCCEILEHLSRPQQAVEEVKRVSKDYAIFSVPHEPFWRMTNMARLSYLGDFGNTPGHIQHFSKKKLGGLLGEYFSGVKIKESSIWLTALCRI